MDSIKTWLVEVILKKVIPSAVKGALAWVVGYLITHAEMLKAMGVVYMPDVQDIVIHLKVFSPWAGGALLAGAMGLFTLLQHHTVAAIKEQPQDGSHERSGDAPNSPKGA